MSLRFSFFSDIGTAYISRFVESLRNSRRAQPRATAAISPASLAKDVIDFTGRSHENSCYRSQPTPIRRFSAEMRAEFSFARQPPQPFLRQPIAAISEAATAAEPE